MLLEVMIVLHMWETNCFPPILDPHLPTWEELRDDWERQRYELQRKELDILSPERAPHSVEDAKNFASLPFEPLDENRC